MSDVGTECPCCLERLAIQLELTAILEENRELEASNRIVAEENGRFARALREALRKRAGGMRK